MPADWKRLARNASDLHVARSSIAVTLPNGRSHEVAISESGDGYLFEAVVAGRRETSRLRDPEIAAWRRNRSSRVVGYRIDERGRLAAHAWSPRDGTTARLFQLMVRTVAREADRHELLVTGTDRR